MKMRGFLIVFGVIWTIGTSGFVVRCGVWRGEPVEDAEVGGGGRGGAGGEGHGTCGGG